MLLSLPKGKMDFALSLEVAGVGKEQGGGTEGGRETSVDFMFGQGHIKKF